MKLFGNSSGKHIRREDVPPPRSSLEPQEQTENVQRPQPERRIEPDTVPAVERVTASARTATAVAERPPATVVDAEPEWNPEKRTSHFWRGYLIYILVFLLIIAAGLSVLWLRMDAYERSRPYRPMDALMEANTPESWRKQLFSAGVAESYLDTLDFNAASYTKKLGVYTDEHPVYSIRFGKKTMLTATLRESRPLRFGFREWMLDSLTLVDSGLTVFVPENATVKLNGTKLGAEYIAERNAQNITLGPLETVRNDIPGLTKYVLNHVFSADGILVTDAEGNDLDLGMQKGTAYYYPPLTSGYVIEAPNAVNVTVNGVTLTDGNAEITHKPLEDFEGLGDSVPVRPEDLTYVIDGLIAVPEVKAVFPDGSELYPAETDEDRWIFRLEPDADFGKTMEDRILTVFDAYIAFLGNRNADLYGNYRHYLSYLVPGSEAAQRAEKSLDSLYWVKGRDTSLDSVSVGDVIRYGDDCFTAWIDFTRRLVDGGDDDNSYIFIFVRYNNEWRVVRVMNKTSFIRNG